MPTPPRHLPAASLEGDIFPNEGVNTPVQMAQAFWNNVQEWVHTGYLPVVTVIDEDGVTHEIDLEIHQEKEEVTMPNWKSGPVCIDELVTVLAQYPTDARWNGWLLPFMDPLAVEEVMAAIEAEDSDHPYTHEWRGETLIVTSYDGEDAYPEELTPDEDGLYSLGAYSWVWSEDTEHPDYEEN